MHVLGTNACTRYECVALCGELKHLDKIFLIYFQLSLVSVCPLLYTPYVVWPIFKMATGGEKVGGGGGRFISQLKLTLAVFYIAP